MMIPTSNADVSSMDATSLGEYAFLPCWCVCFIEFQFPSEWPISMNFSSLMNYYLEI
jgi:hypothetical protein